LIHQGKLKVALLSREYPPDTAWGGIATVYYSLANALVKEGHTVHVICQATGKPRDYIENDVIVHRVGNNDKRYSSIARIDYSVKAWITLNRIIKTDKIDIVDASMWGAEGFLFSLTMSIPMVIRADTSSQDIIETRTYTGIGEQIGLKLLGVLEERTVRKANRIITSSLDNYDYIVNKLKILPKKVSIIHHGIDTNRFRYVRNKFKSELGILDEDSVVLSVGRLEARKGVDILCKAIPYCLALRPNIKFVFIGNDTNTAPGGGAFKEYIVNIAKRTGFEDKLILIAKVPDDTLIQLYSACDLFVTASLQESFGLTVIEALACGKPVVATPVGIVPELIPYSVQGLFVVPVGDYLKLGQAIIKGLSINDEDKKLLSTANRQLIHKEFSLPIWISRITDTYQKTILNSYGTEKY
jgi:glycogen(starch) synthase